eukprot:EG_transcript_23250
MWAALRGRARQQLSTAEATGREDIVAEERGWRAGVRDRLEGHCLRRIRFVAELHGLLSFELRKLRSIRHEVVVRYGCSFREVQRTVDEACRREVAMAVPAPANSGATVALAAAPKWGTRSALWIAPWPAVVVERPRTAVSPKGSPTWHLLTRHNYTTLFASVLQPSFEDPALCGLVVRCTPRYPGTALARGPPVGTVAAGEEGWSGPPWPPVAPHRIRRLLAVTSPPPPHRSGVDGGISPTGTQSCA